MKRFLKRAFSLFLCVIILGLVIAVPSSKAYASSNVFLSDDVIDKFIDMFYTAGDTTADRVNDILSGKQEGTYEDFKGIYKNISAFYGIVDSSFTDLAANETLSNISFLNNIIGGCIDVYDNAASIANSTNAMQTTVDSFQILKGAMTALGCGSYFPTGLSLILGVTEITINIAGYLEKAYFKENVSFYEIDLQIAYYTNDVLPLPNAPSVVGFGLTQDEADSIYAQTYLKYYVKQMMDNVGKPVSGGSGNTGNSITGGIVFEQSNYSIAMNQTSQFTSSYYSSAEQTNITITYSSSDTSVFTVTSDGFVTPVSEGTAQLIATASNGSTASCSITVYIPKIYIEKVFLPAESYDLAMNTKITMTAGYSPGDANTDIGITYSSSNKSIFTVDSTGKVTPVAAGTAKFIATSDNGVQDYCEITIHPFNVSKNTTGYTIDSYVGNSTKVSIPAQFADTPITRIESKVFLNDETITSVTIPDTVTSIGNSAFEGCDNLSSVVMSNNITNIEKYTFFSCDKLSSIKIPNRVTGIGEYAFAYCKALTSITIPNSVQSLSENVFLHCDNLMSVTIGDSVTNLGESAFEYCGSLKSVTLGKSVTSIGKNAFYCCENLTSINIPNSVTSIGDYSFEHCKKLPSITIPSSVTNIGKSVFDVCPSLSAINVDENNANYSSVDGVLFNKNKTDLIKYPASKFNSKYTIPDSVTNISDSAFRSCSNLYAVSIPDSVISVGKYNFSYCSNLSSIWVGNGVSSIGSDTLIECPSLTAINVDKNNNYYSSDDGVLFNKNKTDLIKYPASKVNDEYTIPNNVTRIRGYAFEECKNLAYITIPDSVTSIGGSAFADCSALKSLQIPNSVVGIGTMAFQNCSALVDVQLSESLTAISYGAFSGCVNLKKIIIPEGVTEITSGAFRNCQALENVVLPSTLVSIGKVSSNSIFPSSSIFVIGVFSGCSSLEEIIIPNNVTIIGDKTFEKCKNLNVITIPSSVTKIGKEAFLSCNALTNVFYRGLLSNWSNITIGSSNECLTNAYRFHLCTYSNWSVTTNPTCTMDGLRSKTCLVCDSVVTESLETTGHSYSNEWTVDIKPTCTEEGIKSHHCTACGDKTDITVIAATGHNYEITDFTSVHPHITLYECSFCEAEKIETSFVSACIECIYGEETPIKEIGNTEIDFDSRLIYTSVKNCGDITGILDVSKTTELIITASYKQGSVEFLGTGSGISVYEGDTFIGDFTLIVNGDTNGDSVSDVLDCFDVERAANGNTNLSEVYAMAADSNSDEVVDIVDYQAIVNKALAS